MTGSAPGKWADNSHATVINNANWYPTWPFAGQNVNCNCSSSAYTGAPAMAARAQTASLTKLQGRYAAAIAEQPSAANGFALRVLLDDSAPGGADWYEVRISYATK